MAKYTIATKIKAVQLYEAGNGSTTIAKMLGLPVKGSILRWVYLWQTKGLTGLTKSSLLPKYTIAFKLKVITWLRAHDASFPETAKQFSISHPATIWQWQHQYETQGIAGLTDKRKRARPMATNHELTAVEQLKQLKARNAYLEAENAYLKKLRAVMDQTKKKPKL